MSISVSKTQQNIFVDEVLPALFHRTPEEFLRFIIRDGNKFLRFYWDQAGKDPKLTQQESSLGLNYDLRQPEAHTSVVLVLLPKPRVEGEAYFVALIYRPLRRTPILGISDTTKVLVLEMGAEPGATRLREWTHKLVPELLPWSIEPKVEKFYRAVCTEIEISLPE